jgi:hypothetical protein
MPSNADGGRRSRFVRWFHATFGDWFFRSLIGPSQVDNAIQGGSQRARDGWKRDLESRKRNTRARRERTRRAREAGRRA